MSIKSYLVAFVSLTNDNRLQKFLCTIDTCQQNLVMDLDSQTVSCVHCVAAWAKYADCTLFFDKNVG